jgi:hypothetical protein
VGRYLEKFPNRAVFDGRRGTHALVLGTSTYLPEAKKKFGFGDLDCAALSALRIAKWLVDSYQSASDAPLSSLRILLSPSQLERSLIAEADLEGVGRCTGERVGLALEEWLSDLDSVAGNVAVLYGAGHGMRYQGDGPLLLLEDFWKPRGLTNALDFPMSHLGLEGLRLRASFLFADCCQQIDEVTEQLVQPNPRFAAWDPVRKQLRESSGLYRAALGGGFAYGVQGGTTHFVEALIDGLNGRSATSTTFEDDEDDAVVWEVTTDSLKATLPDLVKERNNGQSAGAFSEGGQPGAFHRLGEPPKANLSVWVKPEAYAPTTSGSIDRQGTILSDFTFSEHPYRTPEPLEAGIYRVAVEAHPPLHFIRPIKDVSVKPFMGGKVTFKVRP